MSMPGDSRAEAEVEVLNRRRRELMGLLGGSLLLGRGGALRAAAAAPAAVTLTDITYESINQTVLQGTFYRPAGKGPFPLVVYVHGGAWVQSDRHGVEAVARALAADGIGVFAIDFRMPPAAMYPASIVDINYAVRWVKANATVFATRAQWVGLAGESSGGHQAVLCALRATDSRYTELPLGGSSALDARVRYVVSLWGVLDPLARYQMAVSRQMQPMIKNHLAYFGGEAQMSEANPQLILERGEPIDRPAILVIYGTADQNVDFHIPQRFVASYRKAGGQVEAGEYPDQPHGFIQSPFSAASVQALAQIRRFIHIHALR